MLSLLVAYPPKLAISVMVNNLKSVSSRLLRQQNTHLRMQSKTGLLWSRSYFVCSTGGATIETFRFMGSVHIGRGFTAFFAKNRGLG